MLRFSIDKYKLEMTTFTCGAVVMSFEMVGSRILAPYLGTSIFTWTSLIGIILGSLSLGNYLGGKMSDNRKYASTKSLSLVILLSSICVGITVLIKDVILLALINKINDIRISSVIASILIFSPASILLGMVSPYAIKLKLKNIKKTGKIVGNLSAISTMGSIFGTFMSGFFLIPFFGTNQLLVYLSLSLLLLSALLDLKKLRLKFITMFSLIFLSITLDVINNFSNKNGFIDVDSTYNRIWIYNSYDEEKNENIKNFSINRENSSAMYLNRNELVYEYTKYYHLAEYFSPNFKSTLMLGGAGYSFPKNFLETYQNRTIDVIEIDPKVTDLAKKHFNLKKNPHLKIYHEDARVFINSTNKKYDVIFGDAFSSENSIPYQLTTLEAVEKKFNILNENGVVILNIISAIEGDKGKFLRAEYKTYKKVFSEVLIFPVNNPKDANKVQNIILVALKSKDRNMFDNENPYYSSFLENQWNKNVSLDMPILTDDYAPVNSYIRETFL